MLLESLLAYAHFVAILSVVVFITSEAALCRAEWLNAAVVRRLVMIQAHIMVLIPLAGSLLARGIWTR